MLHPYHVHISDCFGCYLVMLLERISLCATATSPQQVRSKVAGRPGYGADERWVPGSIKNGAKKLAEVQAGLVVVFKITPFPCLYKIGPGGGVKDILGRRLTLVIITGSILL